MSGSLILNVVALVLMLALLGLAERALKRLTRRHLDRGRRVLRAFVFLAGIAAWGFVTYLLFNNAGEAWFIGFLVVAGLWKLVVDVLLFGLPDQTGSSGPDA